MATPEYHLIDAMRKKSRGKRFTMVELPPRKAKGSSRNFRKPMIAKRHVVQGDRLFTTEEAIWLRH